jgi:heat shock protein HslJ
MLKRIAVLAMPIALLAAACSSSDDTVPTDYSWQLKEIADADGTMSTPVTIPTLAFESDQVAGNASCNQYFGAYSINGSSITFGPLASTQMFCGEPGVMEQEAAYLAALEAVDTWTIDDETLTLSAGDAPLLVYAPISQDLAGSSWDLLAYNNGTGGFQSAVIDVPVTAMFNEDGSLTGSAGCNSYNGTWETEDGSVTIGPLASTRMLCGDEALDQQEARYLEVLETSDTYRIESAILELFDAEGTRILQYHRAATP